MIEHGKRQQKLCDAYQPANATTAKQNGQTNLEPE
jgi:hypothetical protein